MNIVANQIIALIFAINHKYLAAIYPVLRGVSDSSINFIHSLIITKHILIG